MMESSAYNDNKSAEHKTDSQPVKTQGELNLLSVGAELPTAAAAKRDADQVHNSILQDYLNKFLPETKHKITQEIIEATKAGNYQCDYKFDATHLNGGDASTVLFLEGKTMGWLKDQGYTVDYAAPWPAIEIKWD